MPPSSRMQEQWHYSINMINRTVWECKAARGVRQKNAVVQAIFLTVHRNYHCSRQKQNQHESPALLCMFAPMHVYHDSTQLLQG